MKASTKHVKKKSELRLYYIDLSENLNAGNRTKFNENKLRLNGKIDGWTTENYCVISHAMDPGTVHALVTEGFIGEEGNVTVEEITKDTLSNEHRSISGLYERYFKPYNIYPKIG